jgi:hypothetical protein
MAVSGGMAPLPDAGEGRHFLDARRARRRPAFSRCAPSRAAPASVAYGNRIVLTSEGLAAAGDVFSQDRDRDTTRLGGVKRKKTNDASSIS